jgi:hypothetical protein
MSQFRMVYLSLQKTISPIFCFLFSTNVVIEANLYHDNVSEASAVNATVLFYLPPYMMTESLVANISSYSVTYENGVATIEVNILYTYTLYLVLVLDVDNRSKIQNKLENLTYQNRNKRTNSQ